MVTGKDGPKGGKKPRKSKPHRLGRTAPAEYEGTVTIGDSRFTVRAWFKRGQPVVELTEENPAIPLDEGGADLQK